MRKVWDAAALAILVAVYLRGEQQSVIEARGEGNKRLRRGFSL